MSDALEQFRLLMETPRERFVNPTSLRGICLTAVSNIPGALAYVPEHLLSERMCIAAVSGDGRAALKLVPQVLRTQAVCDAALAKDPSAIMYVPTGMVDERMALEAVSRSGDALEGVPRDLRTTAVCTTAMTKIGVDGRAVLALPKWVYNSLLDDQNCEGHHIMFLALSGQRGCLDACAGAFRRRTAGRPPARLGFTLGIHARSCAARTSDGGNVRRCGRCRRHHAQSCTAGSVDARTVQARR